MRLTLGRCTVLFFINGLGGSVMVISFGAMREHNAPENNATALAMLNMFVVGSGAVMQPLIGWMLDLNWGGDMVDGAHVYGEVAYTPAFSSNIVANALGPGVLSAVAGNPLPVAVGR